jgi:hypothetical protein
MLSASSCRLLASVRTGSASGATASATRVILASRGRSMPPPFPKMPTGPEIESWEGFHGEA